MFVDRCTDLKLYVPNHLIQSHEYNGTQKYTSMPITIFKRKIFKVKFTRFYIPRKHIKLTNQRGICCSDIPYFDAVILLPAIIIQ